MRMLACMVVLGSTTASADEATTRADELFAEGQRLKAAGKGDEACEKFSESLKLNHNALGTILNVARCYQQSGKIASAAKLYHDARDRADEAHDQTVMRAADEQIAKLEPDVPHLAIAFTEGPSADTRVLIDGVLVDLAKTSDVPVDPGTRKLVVSAPGRVAYETDVEISTREHKAVAVPKLDYPKVVSKTRRNIGKALVLIGGGAFATSVGLAIYWWHDYKTTTDAHCTKNMTGDFVCPGPFYTSSHDDYQHMRTATYIGAVGVTVAAVGGVLWYLSPKEHQLTPDVAIVPSIGPDGGGVTAIGRF
jgi:hypothetical protein